MTTPSPGSPRRTRRRGPERARALFGCGASALLALSACRGAAPPSTSPSAPHSAVEAREPPLHRGPLVEYVPSAGLRWLLIGSPSHFARHPALSGLRGRWWTASRAQSFSAATGIDLTRTNTALIAGFDLGTLYMADGGGWVGAPEQSFIERLAGSEMIRRPHPRVWSVLGLVGSVPEALVRVDEQFVAIAVRDPRPVRVVELRARGLLTKFVPALRGAALGSLPEPFLTPGPLSFYAPGPLDGAFLGQSPEILAAAHALAISAELTATELVLRAALGGSFGEADRGKLSALFAALAESPEGRLFGLAGHAGVVLDETVSADRVELHARLPLTPVLAGLETFLSDDMGQFFAATAAGPESGSAP